MGVQERMKMCQIIEKMETQKEYSKRLGLENRSSFRGSPVEKREKRGNES